VGSRVRFTRPSLITAAAVAATAALAVGCGSDVKQEGQQLRAQSLLASSPPLARVVITDEAIARYPAGSVERAFFSYWQDLQFHAWRSALTWYDQKLVQLVTPQSMISSLEELASFYRAVKPLIYSVKSTAYGTVEVRYLGARPGGPVELETVEWRRARGTWQIESDSFLNEGLIAYAEQLEQESINPAAQVLSIQAVRAGQRASHLQAAFLSTLIEEARAAHHGSL